MKHVLDHRGKNPIAEIHIHVPTGVLDYGEETEARAFLATALGSHALRAEVVLATGQRVVLDDHGLATARRRGFRAAVTDALLGRLRGQALSPPVRAQLVRDLEALGLEAPRLERGKYRADPDGHRWALLDAWAWLLHGSKRML